jgi:hypothetical protein
MIMFFLAFGDKFGERRAARSAGPTARDGLHVDLVAVLSVCGVYNSHHIAACKRFRFRTSLLPDPRNGPHLTNTFKLQCKDDLRISQLVERLVAVPKAVPVYGGAD